LQFNAYLVFHIYGIRLSLHIYGAECRLLVVLGIHIKNPRWGSNFSGCFFTESLGPKPPSAGGKGVWGRCGAPNT